MKQVHQLITISLFIVHLLIYSGVTAQPREYAFNRQGAACHFRYMCYAPNDNYSTLSRPFVYVLGRPGETPMEIYQRDTVRTIPDFYNYRFYYVPNDGGSARDRLFCLGALVSLTTEHYYFGRRNVFLFVNDESLGREEMVTTGTNQVFASIRLASEDLVKVPGDTASSILEAFKETRSTAAAGGEGELGTYYLDGSAEEVEEITVPMAQKTYFGPPETFDYTLSGLVRDRSTGEALPYATIRIRNHTTGTTTNADGYFTLHKVPSDTSVLLVSYLGYAERQVYLAPHLSKQNFVVELSPSVNMIKGITVVAAREDVVLASQEDISVVRMTPKQIEKLPSLGEKDVMRSFQLMPGVSASQESSSGLYVRGGTPDQNLILYDGFTVYHVDHLYGFFSAFNANALKDVQLYKGGFESRFGGRLSSVTEITGKDGNQKKFNAGGDLSLLSVNAFAEVPIGERFSSVLAYRRSYKGPIYNKLFEQFNSSDDAQAEAPAGGGPGGRGFAQQQGTVTNYFYDLNGKFTYRPDDRNNLSISIFNGTDKLDNSNEFNAPNFGAGNLNFSVSSTDLTRYGNVGSSLRWSRKWTDRIYGNTILSFSNYYSERNRSQERTTVDSNDEEVTVSNGIFENNDLVDYSFKSDYQWNVFDFAQLQFGGFATLYDIQYKYAQNDTTTVLDKNDQDHLAGAYVQNEFRLLSNRLVFLPGIRISHFGATGKLYHEPRASVSLKLTDRLTLKGATGTYYQFANRVTREDILSGSKDFWLLSDGESVPVSSAQHYIAGLSYETAMHLFSAEAYYKEVTDITEYSLRFNPSPTGVSYEENFFSGYGYARGIELLAQKKAGKFKGWVSYTLGEARNHFDVYADGYFPANQDVTHEFKAVMMFNHKRWDFSATWIFATGRPYTAPSGAYTVELLDGETEEFFTVTTKNGLRLPNYHRADISANYKLLAGESGQARRREIGYIGFSIFNLYNRTNVWYKTYTIEDGTVLETNVNYTGITPNLTLSLKIR